MKKILLACTVLLGIVQLTAQDASTPSDPSRNWSLGIYYPVSVGQDFGSSNEGLISSSLEYRFAEAGRTRFGIAADANWFATTFINDSDPVQEEKYRDFFLQLRALSETTLSPDGRLKLIGGVGWAFQRATGPVAMFDSQGMIEGEENNSGLLLSGGLSYDFAPRWYVIAKYDLMFLNGDAPNRTVGLLKIGLGFRF